MTTGEIYSKVAGYDSISPDASPLREDAVLKVASASKFITGIALLQCIDQGLLTLDEPISRVIPEVSDLNIIDNVTDSLEVIDHPPKTPITARHLLTLTSGMGYWFLNPLLTKWRKRPSFKPSNFVTERYATPLLYEPGEGWMYGSSLDWAGVAVRRLHDTTLEEYLIEHIWKPLGRSAPFPTFHISQHPEYKQRLMQGLERTPEGGLKETEFNFGDNPDDEEGGAGLACTMGDYLAVLQDLISPTPQLLKPATISMMFEPQLPSHSTATSMLMQLKPAWDMCAGPVEEEHVNYGLGGLVVLAEAKDIGQPGNMLCWGGASNIVWWICRDEGVAGFFATQMTPFADKKVHKLVNAWKKDFWGKRRGC